MLRLIRPAAAALFLSVAFPILAQQQPPASVQSPIPVFRSGARVVLVPVVVTDHSDHPMSGLTAADFTVLENGKPQTISSFEAVQSQSARAVRTTGPEGAYSNRIKDESQPRMVSIIVMDALNTPVLDQTYARQELLKYLAKQVRRDQLTTLLVLDGAGVHLIHDFTTDPAVLIAALKKAHSKLGNNQESYLLDSDDPSSVVNLSSDEVKVESQAIQSFLAMENEYNLMRRAEKAEQTYRAMQAIAQAYGGLPGRKPLLWATASFPFRLGDPSEFAARGLMSIEDRTFQMLNEANISVYPVDVRGLMYFGPSAAMTRGSARNWRMSPNSAAYQSFVRQTDILQNMKEFADMTGGRAFYNTNDLATAFGKANGDSSFYYMLGYYLEPQAQQKPGWRKLTVKVSRPGTKVRARSGFFVLPAGATSRESANAEIRAALQSPIEFTAVPVSALWISSSWDQKSGKWSEYFELRVPGSAATLQDESRMSLDYVAEAHNPDGSGAAITSQTVTAKVKDPAKVRAGTMRYRGILQVPPGTYKVTFLVRDSFSGKMGTVIVPLTVKTKASP